MLAVEHHLHELVLEQLGGKVGHPKVALELQRRDTVLGRRHQVHRQEPSGQRQLAGLEHGAADQAALIATRVALEVQPIADLDAGTRCGRLSGTALTARADKALGPSPCPRADHVCLWFVYSRGDQF